MPSVEPNTTLLGARLLEAGVISEDQLDLALREQKRLRAYLGETLVGLGFVSQETLTSYLAQSTQAEVILRPVFETPPLTWEPWHLMATTQLALGHLAKAEQYIEEGLARDGTVPRLWIQRALLAQQLGQLEQALAALNQAALLQPELPAIQLNKGYLFELEGNIPLATQHYRRFLTLTEGKPTYHGIRKKILRRVNHHASSASKLSAYNR